MSPAGDKPGVGQIPRIAASGLPAISPEAPGLSESAPTLRKLAFSKNTGICLAHRVAAESRGAVLETVSN